MSASRIKRLSQYLTAVWAAGQLFERHFGHLRPGDIIIEPSCGRGAFLQAIPREIRAIGVDICPDMVEMARNETGREIILGDFATVPIDVTPTAIIGNPPFQLETVDRFLDRAHTLLPEGGQVGFLLPTYAFQTANRVSGYAEKWSMFQEMVPRNIFDGLTKPLTFAVFTKDKRRKLIGFALYHEMSDVQRLPKQYRNDLEQGGGPVWLNVTRRALAALGGEASLTDIYAEIQGKRPTKTNFWRPQIRKVVRQYADHFRPVSRGRYALI